MKVHPKTAQIYNNLSLKKVRFLTDTFEGFGIEITEPLLECLVESVRKIQAKAMETDCIGDEAVRRLGGLNRK